MISDAAREDFVAGFIAATLWANSYGDTPTGEAPREADADRLTTEDRAALTLHADAFLTAHAVDLSEYVAVRSLAGPYRGDEWGEAGHDLALTGAGHGTGFWDRGAGAVGDRLSEAARLHGHFQVQVQADGALSVHEG